MLHDIQNTGALEAARLTSGEEIDPPRALAEMFNLARSLNKASDDEERRSLAAALLAAGALLGLIRQDPEAWFAGDDGELSADDIETLLEQREAARAAKDFATADGIRDQLAAAGIQIEDGSGGTRWRRH